MCGIFGYVGSQSAVDISIAGLKKLEYRGYDSSGIAGVIDNKLEHCKAVGKIQQMESKALGSKLKLKSAIAHTRWATHGKPTVDNAHPHCDSDNTLAVVHNGIIENHDALRKMLQEKGVAFQSDTDTEVIAQLISTLYEGNILAALQKAMPYLKGALAIALVHKDHPDEILVAARQSPLTIGIGNGEAFVASDANAFLVHTREVIYLSDSEVAIVKPDGIQIFDEATSQVQKKSEFLTIEGGDVSKGDYEHFMLKEIYEQPQAIRNALLSRFSEEFGTANFSEINISEEQLHQVEEVVILACGTSWHAGLLCAGMLEDMARLPTRVEISSEYRYKNPIIPQNALVIAVSQSGETADTLAAMRECQEKGAKVVGICNVQGSTLAREADSCIFMRSGTEVGVAATKSFTSQVIIMALFALYMARMRNMSKSQGQKFLAHLIALPEAVEKVLGQSEHIRAIAKKYAGYQDFFFLGRRYMYPTCLEGALKLKEISYINANAYPAGEMKHGPIALINESCPTVAFCANQQTYEKILSNMMEIKARNGAVVAIVPESSEGLNENVADDFIVVPVVCDELATIPSSVAGQLLAYYIAYEKGAEIDQPRNLAKSVTVE
ncbi:MAG: glutamine--fructose-6-phosphate transaminase (isomerizing) [Chlamydiota bacterium]